MFGFKKKDVPHKAVEENQSQEYKTFAADFLPEETEILAVTGASGFDGEPAGDSGLWRASIGLSAWMDEYDKEVRREEVLLEAMVEEKLLDYLRTQVGRDSILEATVRMSTDGSRFLFTDLPRPGYDPELKAILEEQKKPVTLEAEGLGVFTLNRVLGWFETAVDWLGTEIVLTFDQAEEGRAAAQETARALLNEKEAWDARLRGYAAGELLDQASERAGEPVTQEEFCEGLEVESILAAPEGAFEIWFNGGEFFPGGAVHVAGDLKQGPLHAETEE